MTKQAKNLQDRSVTNNTKHFKSLKFAPKYGVLEPYHNIKVDNF